MNPKIYYEEDNIGKHKVLDYSKLDDNGKLVGKPKKIRILVEPSEWYKQKQELSLQRQKEKRAIMKEKNEKEKMIRIKMRELAIAELQKEGKIT
jgi:hypothetical protein